MAAAARGHGATVALLLDNNVEVNARNRWGTTALTEAKKIVGSAPMVELLKSVGAVE